MGEFILTRISTHVVHTQEQASLAPVHMLDILIIDIYLTPLSKILDPSRICIAQMPI